MPVRARQRFSKTLQGIKTVGLIEYLLDLVGSLRRLVSSVRIFLAAVAVAVLASACAAGSPRPGAVPPLPTEPLVAGPDELDRFWRLIEASAQHSDDLDAREEWLTASLTKLSVKEIVEFEETRARVKARADTWLMWDAAEVIQGWSSDDVFWYFVPTPPSPS